MADVSVFLRPFILLQYLTIDTVSSSFPFKALLQILLPDSWLTLCTCPENRTSPPRLPLQTGAGGLPRVNHAAPPLADPTPGGRRAARVAHVAAPPAPSIQPGGRELIVRGARRSGGAVIKRRQSGLLSYYGICNRSAMNSKSTRAVGNLLPFPAPPAPALPEGSVCLCVRHWGGGGSTVTRP